MSLRLEQQLENHRCLLLEQQLGIHMSLLLEQVHTGKGLVQVEFESLVWVLEDHRLVQVPDSLELELELGMKVQELVHDKRVLEHYKLELEHYKMELEHYKMERVLHMMVSGLAWQVFSLPCFHSTG